jgi:protein O-GlcNAc transferase
MLDLQAGRLQVAEEAERTSIRLDPRCDECYYGLGLILKAVGNNQEANLAFRKAVELNVHNVGAWYYVAQLEHERGLTSDGITSLRTALIANPENAKLWAALTRLLIVDTNRFETARDCASQAVKLDPRSGALQEALGDVLILRAASKVDALNAYRRADELYSAAAESSSVTRLVRKLSVAENPPALDTNTHQ